MSPEVKEMIVYTCLLAMMLIFALGTFWMLELILGFVA